MLKNIAIAIVVLLIGFLGFVQMRPNESTVTRSASIKAPPDKIEALVSDFHRWNEWSPWEKLDSAMKRTFSGAETGKGAIYEWNGNDKVGQGRMEILEVASASKVVIKLDFIKPFESSNTTEFDLVDKGELTEVTWTMKGKNNFMSKLFGVFMDIDSMVGKDFEQGLANMKVAAEK
jgi:carbon monoxide dehydrogenase subunit G